MKKIISTFVVWILGCISLNAQTTNSEKLAHILVDGYASQPIQADDRSTLKALLELWFQTGNPIYYNLANTKVSQMLGNEISSSNKDILSNAALALVQHSIPNKQALADKLKEMYPIKTNLNPELKYAADLFNRSFEKVFNKSERASADIDLSKIKMEISNSDFKSTVWSLLTLVDNLDYQQPESVEANNSIKSLNQLSELLANNLATFEKQDLALSNILVYAWTKAALSGYLDDSYGLHAAKIYDSEDKNIDWKKAGNFDLAWAVLASIEREKWVEAVTFKPKKVALDYYFNREFRKDINGNTEQFHYTWDDRTHSGFWLWGRIFQGLNADIAIVRDAPTKTNLKNADAYIIVDPDTKKETKEPNYISKTDIKNIKSWVKKGGTLVLMTNDTTNCEVLKSNELAKVFGITFSMKNTNFIQGQNFAQAAVDLAAGNEVFKNPGKVYIKELVTLNVGPAAKALVKKGDDIIMATAKYGKGKVFVIGDPWLYNEYLDGRIIGKDFINILAAKDLAKWMLKDN